MYTIECTDKVCDFYTEKNIYIGQHKSNVKQCTKAGKKVTGTKHKKKFGIGYKYIIGIMTYLFVICYRLASMLFQSSK